ncbi:DNA polymerase, partial [Salmonella enterica subsp. enterica serovar Virginia]|nr:DNA polymerase [Salmonella enterica subsp. enterica serovar Virginia]
STSEEVLEELALDYPLPKVILEYRGLAKLKSTYTDKLPLMINLVDDRAPLRFNAPRCPDSSVGRAGD